MITRNDEICPWCRAKEVFDGSTIHRELYIPNVDKTYDLIEVPFKDMEGKLSKLSIYRDITQRKRREERLKVSEEDYKRLFDNVGCGVYISSKGGRFLNANQALLNMLDYKSKEEFLGTPSAKSAFF